MSSIDALFNNMVLGRRQDNFSSGPFGKRNDGNRPFRSTRSHLHWAGEVAPTRRPAEIGNNADGVIEPMPTQRGGGGRINLTGFG